MFLTLVILFWLAVIAAAIYRYRNFRPVAEFLTGFAYPWYAVVTAKAPPEEWQPRDDDFSSNGFVGGVLSLIVLAIFVVVGMVLTILWCF